MRVITDAVARIPKPHPVVACKRVIVVGEPLNGDTLEAGEAKAYLDGSHPLSRQASRSPVTIEAEPVPTTGRIRMSGIEDQVKEDLSKGLEYVEGWVARIKQHAPAVISTAETVANSTVGALVEAVAGRVLPSDLETELADVVKSFIDSKVGAATTASTTAAPAATADTVVPETTAAPAAAAAPTQVTK